MNLYKGDLHKKTKKLNFSNEIIIVLIISVIGLGILLQAFRWQVIDNDKFVAMAQAQYQTQTSSDTGRGTIYASDGTILAIDQPAWIVYASLSSLPNERTEFFKYKEKYVATVTSILGLSKEDVESKITDNFRSVQLADSVSDDKKIALEQAQIFDPQYKGLGFYFVKQEQRVYPNGNLASHVLGFIGKDATGQYVGQYGIEGFFASDLAGSSGKTYEEKDSQGNVILTSEYQPVLPREGKSFTLTIVPGLQRKVEQVLKTGVEQTESKSGSVIIMDPNTGAILAMANYPDYDPNDYWKVTDPWIYKNKAVSDVYEYGSAQKPITEAIALESGKVKPDYICNDATGSLKLYDKTIYTWNKLPNGKLTLAGILEKSNNPCAAQVALATGFQYFYPKLEQFGFGNFVGLGLQEEAAGYLKPYAEWTKLDLATTAFGQSISATALQIISAMSTIANEGKRMQPYLISQVDEGNSNTYTFTPRVAAQPISAQTAAIVAQNMVGSAKDGEAHRLFSVSVPNYDIAGKTGTAQVPLPDRPGYYTDRTNATFVGFAPSKNAKMIMIVRLEEPAINTYAASTAVPVWINIFKAVADDLGIPKE